MQRDTGTPAIEGTFIDKDGITKAVKVYWVYNTGLTTYVCEISDGRKVVVEEIADWEWRDKEIKAKTFLVEKVAAIINKANKYVNGIYE